MLNVQGDVSQAADGRFKADTNAPFSVRPPEHTATGSDRGKLQQS